VGFGGFILGLRSRVNFGIIVALMGAHIPMQSGTSIAHTKSSPSPHPAQAPPLSNFAAHKAEQKTAFQVSTPKARANCSASLPYPPIKKAEKQRVMGTFLLCLTQLSTGCKHVRNVQRPHPPRTQRKTRTKPR
jgi:hypothetical protein